MSDRIVIVGGGHAAAQLCSGLAAAGLGNRTTLVCEEPSPPYHRPPLSKAFLKSAQEPLQTHKELAWYEAAGIALHLGDPAVGIDLDGHTLALRSGATLPWDRLVLATGTRARRLPGFADGLDNVAYLRNAAEATHLRERLDAARRVAVLGGGFIGLEVAATAAAAGKTVTVLEAAPRLLARAVSPELAAHVASTHRAAGIELRFGVRSTDFEVEPRRVVSIRTEAEAPALALDLLLVGIGAVPETTLAHAAGIACEDGIVVDAHMRTSHPDVLAVGDCTRFPDGRAGRPLRLESVQNANDQAKTAVSTLTGELRAHDALPWFWSEQGALRLQMAGLYPAGAPGLSSVRRAGASDASFTLLHYVDGRFVCAESANAPADHLMTRKLLEAGRSPDPACAADPAVPLKTHLA